MAIPVQAITEAISIAATIASNPELLDQAAKLADSATKAIGAGDKTAEAAAEALGPVASKARGAGAEIGGKAVGAGRKAISDTSKKVGGLIGGASSKVKGVQEARAKEKGLADARRQILLSASASVSAADFEHDWQNALDCNGIMPLRSPGYYVIATYKGKPGRDAAANYEDVYVARSENMGESVHRHICGGGNPDVYADIKYGKHVHVYAFPDFDDTDDDNQVLQSFVTALGAADSYNARIAREFAGSGLAVNIIASLDFEQRAVSGIRRTFAGAEVVERELCGDGVVALRATAMPYTVIGLLTE